MSSHSNASAYFRRAPRLNGCPFCAQPGHGVRWCTIAEEYCRTGRIVIRNARLHLPNGQPIPNSSNGCGLKDAVNAWLAANSAQVFSYLATLTAPTPVALPSSHHLLSLCNASISMLTQLRFLQWELDDLITSSSRLCMCNQEDVSEYYWNFRAICEPLVHAHHLSYEDCNELFCYETLSSSERRDPRRDFVSETLEQESCQPVAFTPTTAIAPASSSAATTVPKSPASTSISPLPAVVIDSTSVLPTVISPPLPAIASMSPVSIPAVPTSSAIPITSFTTAIFDSPTVITLAPPASAVPASPAFAIVTTSSAPATIASAATSPIATFPVSAQPAPAPSVSPAVATVSAPFTTTISALPTDVLAPPATSALAALSATPAFVSSTPTPSVSSVTSFTATVASVMPATDFVSILASPALVSSAQFAVLPASSAAATVPLVSAMPSAPAVSVSAC
ncbi:hypothetical protein F5148DRAFT_1324582 [Russula earlei]|uniref:Uncharacterized protein n=1 Tax=Russula earlei TaxID=71964 RepID=A0ACC0U0D8_9AGAM|nr:hypothetical protein F5148DRAFT_1324582 [Russula earlei]